MDDILQDLSPAKLVAANEENLSSWIPILGKMGEARLNDPPGVRRAVSDIPLALFNSIMDARLVDENVDATIQYIIADARVRNVPVLWWIGPSTRPLDLGKYLEKYGFTIDDDGPGMAVVLSNLNVSLPVPAGLSIHAAQDDASWWEWCRTMALGFEAPATRVDFMVNSWHNLLGRLNPETTRAYIGRLNDKPVATSMLQLGGGAAGIYAVSTIPEARRKGIGAQVTLYPLLEARARGYRVGVLQASEMGFGVYQSLGFQEYCRISSYRWIPNRS